jgi:hypothetical protein
MARQFRRAIFFAIFSSFFAETEQNGLVLWLIAVLNAENTVTHYTF